LPHISDCLATDLGRICPVRVFNWDRFHHCTSGKTEVGWLSAVMAGAKTLVSWNSIIASAASSIWAWEVRGSLSIALNKSGGWSIKRAGTMRFRECRLLMLSALMALETQG
jgi:hypothetical protein